MFTLYPSNKLEHLSALVSGLLAAQPSSVFEPECILVENPGMQHWLNLSLANTNALSMNLSFPLTSRFVWDMARQVLGDDGIPSHSPYRREVLRYRIAQILQSEEFTLSPDNDVVTQYWRDPQGSRIEGQKRMNLAIEIADAFEQYILFRPQWLADWENNIDPVASITSQWQSSLWRELVAEQPWHPANLLHNTTQSLHEMHDNGQTLEGLPKRIILFAVNALAPSLLAFFDALAKHSDVHFFYLNPSVNYWGELQSDKALAYQQRQAQFEQSTLDTQGNRLLANLGQHGRDLLNRLTEMESFEISAFEQPHPSETVSPTLLGHLQTAIYDSEPVQNVNDSEEDDSITTVSCHTALRELQVLHDYLIKRMAADTELLGRDIVVLCPAIEDYAPYVYSVFSRPGSDEASRITCTVSDRNLIATDPFVSAFITLLSLPDSRFSVSSVLAFLENNAIAQQFGFDPDDIEKVHVWLNHAAIRWGIDSVHKANQAELDTASEQNSWSWGLQRLLLGMASADSPSLVDEYLSVPDVEGLDSVVLGKLIGFIAFLQSLTVSLRGEKSMREWVVLLRSLCQQAFGDKPQNERGIETINGALTDLVLQTEQANYDAALTLEEVMVLLDNAFSSPDVRNQFLTGHVTFCSMMPMRSVPFKVVAVLGLNDGQFPRKSTPQSLNLMTTRPPEKGDRSRAREDRYLFLEAILSARQALYLSYQGRSSRDDSERMPSPVLALFIDECRNLNANAATIHHHPLHHFSPKNYSQTIQSLNQGGYRLANTLLGAGEDDDAANFNPQLTHVEQESVISVNTIAACLDNPIAYFAQTQLDVNLVQQAQQLSDDEPFMVDGLTQYQSLERAMTVGIDDAITHAKYSGLLPDNALADATFAQWQSGLALLEDVLPFSFEDVKSQAYDVQVGNMSVVAKANVNGQVLTDFHIASQSAKRKIRQWLTHLVVNAVATEPVVSHIFYVDWKKTGDVKQVTIAPISPDEATALLEKFVNAYRRSLHSPCLFHAKMGEALARAKAPESVWQVHMFGNDQLPGIANDPYFQWLVADEPNMDVWLEEVLNLYGPMVAGWKEAKVKHD